MWMPLAYGPHVALTYEIAVYGTDGIAITLADFFEDIFRGSECPPLHQTVMPDVFCPTECIRMTIHVALATVAVLSTNLRAYSLTRLMVVIGESLHRPPLPLLSLSSPCPFFLRLQHGSNSGS